ncbi:ORF in transposon ISC1290 [Saccharolobus solfataricus]|uniref:ORF in transposon ISC1290 n=1 Tax=Saccharolobus solfataricus TaxID=2287 RepID=A0A157T2B4_SACSO|nr:ORF in transposon ISC1290 [Saccharolobus solfataricus]
MILKWNWLTDNKVGFSVGGYKVVDRGFLGKSSTWLIGFSDFRRHVEFFGIFLRRYWRALCDE